MMRETTMMMLRVVKNEALFATRVSSTAAKRTTTEVKKRRFSASSSAFGKREKEDNDDASHWNHRLERVLEQKLQQPEPTSSMESCAIDPNKKTTSSQIVVDDKYGENIYTGAFSETVKRVKMLSLGSLAATVFGCPLLIELSAGASLDASSKIVLAGSMSSIGAFTTIMLQWFVNPYVRRLWVDSETKTKVTAEKTSLLLQTYYAKFDLKDMKVCDSSHPLVTWEANGEKFYVEPASTSEETYALLQLERFEPDTSKDAPMGYDDDEDEDENENKKK
jgi:hypothetical protein